MNPQLNITMDASKHDMYYLTPNDSIDIPQKGIDDPLYEKLDQFRHEKLNGRYQMALLFKDPAVVGDFVDGYQLADGLWNIASDMHCLPELELSFNDLFTVDELIAGACGRVSCPARVPTTTPSIPCCRTSSTRPTS